MKMNMKKLIPIAVIVGVLLVLGLSKIGSTQNNLPPIESFDTETQAKITDLITRIQETQAQLDELQNTNANSENDIYKDYLVKSQK